MNIHIVDIIRHTDRHTKSGACLAKYDLNAPNIGVVHAITISNEHCWIVYETSGKLDQHEELSIEELVCEVAFTTTRTIFLALHRSKAAA